MNHMRIVRQSECCPHQQDEGIRSITGVEPRIKGIYSSRIRLSPEVASFKALVYYFGKQDSYNVKRVGLIGSSGRIGQAAQSVGSYVLPGNLSPFRSPIRSAGWGAIIPGTPGVGGVRPGRKKTHRCPEGYQYGGRFTDNRLSTCGQQLFDLPGALGMAIGAIRRLAREIERATSIPAVEGRALGAGQYSDVIESRRPQIPRVADANEKLRFEAVDRLIKEMGQPGIKATRMVRRDGFVLEPVVSPRVLRSIPDNRDMEGATFILSANRLPDLGGDELGMLSNTGINQLVYVLPDGSSLSLRKKRELTTGERRKLGRTVNTAAAIDNSQNPVARLQEVVKQTGDGIEFSEKFVSVKNPHEIVKLKNGRTIERWVHELFNKRKAKATPASRPTSSQGAISEKITSLDKAAEHIAAGGSLADIGPEILAEALTKASLFKRSTVNSSLARLTTTDKREFWLYTPRTDFEHLNAMLASDFQQHLQLESPDVAIAGLGDRRNYVIQSTNQVYQGLAPSVEKGIESISPRQMARLMVSDFVTGVPNRSPSTIDAIEVGEDVVPVSIFNDTSLTDLAKLKIRERTEKMIAEMRSLQESGVYGKYLRELRREQQRLVLREIEQLIQRARLFNFVHFSQRLAIDGKLTDAEKRHLKIVQRISEQRIDVLESFRDAIATILKGPA